MTKVRRKLNEALTAMLVAFKAVSVTLTLYLALTQGSIDTFVTNNHDIAENQ